MTGMAVVTRADGREGGEEEDIVADGRVDKPKSKVFLEVLADPCRMQICKASIKINHNQGLYFL